MRIIWKTLCITMIFAALTEWQKTENTTVVPTDTSVTTATKVPTEIPMIGPTATSTPTPIPTATPTPVVGIPPVYSDLTPVEKVDTSGWEIATEPDGIILYTFEGVTYSNEIKQWQCGDNANLTVYNNGTLVVSGTGPMWDGYAYGGFDKCGWRLDDAYLGKYVKKIIIEEGITYVGRLAFDACCSVEYIDIASTVKEIGMSAFSMLAPAENLKEIKLREGLEIVGYQAFDNCLSSCIAELILPSTVTYIGEMAFRFNFKNYDNIALKSFMIPASVTTVEKSAFFGWISFTGENHVAIYVEGKDSLNDFDIYEDVFNLDAKLYNLPKGFDVTTKFIFLGK